MLLYYCVSFHIKHRSGSSMASCGVAQVWYGPAPLRLRIILVHTFFVSFLRGINYRGARAIIRPI